MKMKQLQLQRVEQKMEHSATGFSHFLIVLGFCFALESGEALKEEVVKCSLWSVFGDVFRKGFFFFGERCRW